MIKRTFTALLVACSFTFTSLASDEEELARSYKDFTEGDTVTWLDGSKGTVVRVLEDENKCVVETAGSRRVVTFKQIWSTARSVERAEAAGNK